MKHLKILPVILSLVFLTACNSEQPVQNSETVSESETSAVITTSAEITTETETETVPETEPAEAAEENSDEPEYVEVSIGNEFIDFEFVENYQGATDIGDLADKAIEFVKSTEQYADSVKNIDKFSYKAIKEIHTDEKYAKEDADKVAPYINGGNIEPLVSAAYTADYDGDGKTETFIAVDIPYIVWSHPDVWSFLLFIDGSENTDPVLLDFYEGYSASMLNYGKNKQLIFGGWDGMHSYASIYGVKGGKPITLYDHCPGGYFRKTDCFLSVFGLQGWSDFMYFDTAVREYRIIKGVEISRDEMAELDVSGTLCSHCNAENITELPDYVEFHFIKPNYYLLDWGFPGSHLFTYENGIFTFVEDTTITRSVNGSDLDIIAEFDIDKAVAEMKKPVEPYTTVSPDNEFIDYNFIANYPGTTDIGDLADKAVDFLKTTEDYADSAENYSMFTEEGIRNRYKDYTYVRIDGTVDDSSREKDILEMIEYFSEYLDEKGSIVPKLDAAYHGDYDGDGKEEAFIVINMPIAQGDRGIIRSFLIFSDSSGKMQLLDNFSGAYPTVLLDYGICRHIAIGGYGTVGADDHTRLYGVRNGKAEVLYYGRCSFYKEDCFLAIYGWQGSGCFMYFDTAAREYRAIDSVSVSLEEIRKMDKDNVLAEYYDWYEEKGYVFFNLIGGKYYCASLGPMDTGEIYTYENGRFVPQEDCRARWSDYFDGSTVTDMDIDRALSQMKPITEPFSPITKGSTPINFEYIENYQSAADTDRYAEALQKYVNESFAFSSTTDEVCEAAEKDFPDYTDNNGSLIPKILAAYPNDYDGDGREETFVVFEIPFKTYNNEEPFGLKSFLLFIDDDDEEKWLTYYSRYPVNADNVVLLDYGSKKHLLFIGEEESATKLYGVKNGYVKEYFSGSNCTVKKNGCLLDISYGTGGGCTLYYDNIADDYLTLSGRNLFDGSSMPSPISVSGE